MQPKNKILSFSVLVIYLVTALHSVSPPVPPEALHHHHKDFEAVHHEHAFHIGIFHFLGHLLEKIGQQPDITDDYLQPAIVLPSKNVDDEKSLPISGHVAVFSNTVEGEVNINDPPDFPFYISISQLSILSSRPLRAPPVC